MELLLDLAELLARRLVAELHPLDAILQLELETKIREVITIMIMEKSPDGHVIVKSSRTLV